MLKLAFRYRADGTEHLPAAGGYVLAAGHLSNLDPWAIGLAIWPRRFLRFMAKSELFWFPLSVIIAGAGAFKVNRGQADYAAIDTAVRLAREGNVIAMFPEGTRRRKGLRKKHEAGRTPAPRGSRSRRGAARPGGDQGHRRPAQAGAVARALRRADRDRRSARQELAEAARTATDRLMAAIQALEASL